jgi:hypothetical protein
VSRAWIAALIAASAVVALGVGAVVGLYVAALQAFGS